MPELLPSRPVRFHNAFGGDIAGWATFHNPDTDVLTVEWLGPHGRRTVDYVAASAVDLETRPVGDRLRRAG